MRKPLVYNRLGLKRAIVRRDSKYIDSYFNIYSENLSHPAMADRYGRIRYWGSRSINPKLMSEDDWEFLEWLLRAKVKDNGEDE